MIEHTGVGGRQSRSGCTTRALPYLLSLFALGVLRAQAVTAQPGQRVAPSATESAIARGRFDEAESALYAASRLSPRDPAARSALGSFLAARGRLKVGAVLLVEARQFGADASIVDERLSHVYAWLGSWHLVAALPSARSREGVARARATWQASHASTRSGADSAVVRLEPNELAGLGRIAITVGGVALEADIDPDVEELVLPATAALLGEVQLFGTQGEFAIAVARAISIGTMSFNNVPARLGPAGSARVGLNLLASLHPTFDPAARRLILRTAEPDAALGEAIPFLLTFPGVRIVPRPGEAPASLASAAGRAALRGASWMFDLKRGALIVPRLPPAIHQLHQ